MARPAEELAHLFDWLHLEYDEAACERAVAACSADRMVKAPERVRAPASMRSFVRTAVRKGDVDSWKRELSPSQIATVEYLTCGLMREYGYAPVANRKSRVTFRVATADLLHAVRDRTAGAFDRIIPRL